MQILDIIIILIFIGMAIRGAIKGFIGQAVGILSLLVAVWAGSRYSVMISEWLKSAMSLDASPQAMKIVVFILLLIIVMILGHLLARVLEGVVKLSLLGWANKLLGMLLSLLSAFIVAGVLLYVFNYLNGIMDIIPAEKINSSKMCRFIMSATDSLFPYIKQVFKF